MTTYSLDSTLGFGKYRGKILAQVLELDPQYLVWSLKNVKTFYLDADAGNMLCKRCPYQRQEIIAEMKYKSEQVRNTHLFAWEEDALAQAEAIEEEYRLMAEAIEEENNVMADFLLQQKEDEEQHYLDLLDDLEQQYFDM